MPVCTESGIEFPALGRRRVEASFCGGEVTSDGGVLLLREVDRRLGLLTAVNRAEALASSATLCRLENRMVREAAVAIHGIFVGQFIASRRRAPKELVLDFDATDDPLHGHQEGRFFHGYYDRYCFLPLYVFCGEQLLVSYLRRSNIDGARHAWAILTLLVKRFRQAWPKVRIIVRGDSGFCRPRMLRWCERHGVGYERALPGKGPCISAPTFTGGMNSSPKRCTTDGRF
jgi:hypothetical protein